MNSKFPAKNCQFQISRQEIDDLLTVGRDAGQTKRADRLRRRIQDRRLDALPPNLRSVVSYLVRAVVSRGVLPAEGSWKGRRKQQI